MEELLERLKKYRVDEDISYKQIAIETQIPFSTFYNFSSGVRPLRKKYAEVLDQYLASKGY